MKIFLDLDGVVADWLGHYCSCFNVDITDKEFREKVKKCPQLDDLGETVWTNIESLDFNWWANIPLFPWSRKLVRELEDVGDVTFLTSPGNIFERPDAAGIAAHGKTVWVTKHFTTPLLIAHQKEKVAGPDAILVDDSKHKIDPFAENGGNAFHWPNSLAILDGDVDIDEVINDLIEMIKDLTNKST